MLDKTHHNEPLIMNYDIPKLMLLNGNSVNNRMHFAFSKEDHPIPESLSAKLLKLEV